MEYCTALKILHVVPAACRSSVSQQMQAFKPHKRYMLFWKQREALWMCFSHIFNKLLVYFRSSVKISLEQQKPAGSLNADKNLSCQYAIHETNGISATKCETFLVSHTRSALSCRDSSCHQDVLCEADSFVHFGVQTKSVNCLFSVTFLMYSLRS